MVKPRQPELRMHRADHGGCAWQKCQKVVQALTLVSAFDLCRYISMGGRS